MDVEAALQRANELVKSSWPMRKHMEAKAGLAMLMTYYKQNGRLAAGQRGGNGLYPLRPVTDRNSPAVRVCINRIRPAVEMANSRQMPRELDWTITPPGVSTGDEIGSRVSDKRLRDHFTKINGLSRLRNRHLWSTVLGSVILRRIITCAPTGKAILDRDGEPLIDRNKKPVQIRRYSHDWMVCPPYEFIRTPEARSHDFSEESVIGHEKPLSTEELYRRYGVKLQTKMTMGRLYDFQAFIHRATGHNMGSGIEHNHRPGVLFSEWWFRDMSPEADGQWLFYMQAYRDVVAEDPDDRGLKPVFFGMNPYVDLPLHHFYYGAVPNWAWGQGIPEMVMDEQHLLNDAMTSMARVMLEQGGSKIMYEAGALDDRVASRTLMKRFGVIKLNKPNYPQRLDPPQLDQHAVLFSQGADKLFDRALNQSEAQRGGGGTRTAGVTQQMRMEAADSTITARIDTDRLEVNQLLTGTLGDLCMIDTDGLRTKTTRKELEDEFSPSEVDAYIARATNWKKRPFRVTVAQESLSPKTPREVREELYAAIDRKAMDPATAARTFLLRTGQGLDPLQELAHRKQKAEIHSMVHGQKISATSGQDHDTHLWTLRMEKDSPRWESYPKDVKSMMEDHEDEHRLLRAIEAQEQMSMQQNGAMGPEEPALAQEVPQAQAALSAPEMPMQPTVGPVPEMMPDMQGLLQ